MAFKAPPVSRWKPPCPTFRLRHDPSDAEMQAREQRCALAWKKQMTSVLDETRIDPTTITLRETDLAAMNMKWGDIFSEYLECQ
jgi:hypothetical protein